MDARSRCLKSLLLGSVWSLALHMSNASVRTREASYRGLTRLACWPEYDLDGAADFCAVDQVVIADIDYVKKKFDI